MTGSALRRLLLFLAAFSVALPAGIALGQGDAARVDVLIRDVKSPDYEKASAAESELRKFPRERARIVAGLIDALRTGEWNRCSGDMRDGIARTLIDLKAKDAVVPLLELVKSGRSIEHECAE
jgi:HEAT repeat protein